MLYPSTKAPHFGIFIKREVDSLAGKVRQKVIVPQPWRPSGGQVSMGNCNRKRVAQSNGVEIFYQDYMPLPGTLFLPFKGVWFFIFLFKLVKRIQRDFDFDAIHAHNVYPEGFCAVLFKQIFKKPVILSSRGNDLNNYPRYSILRGMITYALRHADSVITVSKSLGKKAHALGADFSKISIMPKGVDMNLFRPMSKTETRRKLGLPTDKTIILSVGWLIPRKNPHSFIKALLHYSAEDRDKLFFVWVGEGPLRQKVEKEIRQHQLESNVLLAGRCPPEAIPVWINAADIFLLVSFSEGMPNVLYESMACGAPVIASDVDGASEILEHMKTGILVSPFDYSRIARNILELANDKNLRDRLGRKGREYMLAKQLRWENNASWLLQKYQHLFNHGVE